MTSPKDKLSVLWFRHGLRIHDNPSLHEAIATPGAKVLPIFIFDGQSAGTWLCGYNRFTYLLEILQDLDQKFRSFGTKLHIFHGDPVDVLKEINQHTPIVKLCFEQDPEPIWKKRDDAVKDFCQGNKIEWVEKFGHTLWDPHEVIQCNGGQPPLTFSEFNFIISSMGSPARPLPDVDLSQVGLAQLETIPKLFDHMPSPEELGCHREEGQLEHDKKYIGGESQALEHYAKRLAVELEAFKKHKFLPNRINPDILCPPRSLSPDLKFGCLSVRKFYWGVMDAFEISRQGTSKPFNPQIVVQLLWREFFYTMSVDNIYYNEMERNKICINIPWYDAPDHMKAYSRGQTGYPLIDAGVRQLVKEGWIHHIIRNALATFLTRGDLWINWVEGANFFLKYLLDGDWAVNAGNWMWISSSAFEERLNCPTCIDPGTFGRTADPWGDYVRRYVPELAQYPVEYIYEPWLAPLDVQKKAGCLIGKDYPQRIVIHEEASRQNTLKMREIKAQLLEQGQNEIPKHVMPSDEKETEKLLIFADDCTTHAH